MKSRVFPLGAFLLLQGVVVVAFAASTFVAPSVSTNKIQTSLGGGNTFASVPVERTEPLEIAPLYDDPEVVSDEELAAVLDKLLPRFSPEQRKPNHIEHALRTWKIRAEFVDPTVMSGEAMKEFLTDHGKYLASWGNDAEPLLEEKPDGIAIRWGRGEGASVHHDHWLACLTEAGVSLDQPVYTPTRSGMLIYDVLQQSLLDFRLDERETEWSAMAFGLWLAPVKNWRSGDGREMSFDLLAKRLMRGYKQLGVCGGTHRVYSMMVLIRLDDEYQILSKPIRAQVYGELQKIRDLITAAQFEDGHWPYNWPEGKRAVEEPTDIPMYRHVIATGHHLEWLAIAPKELHPPREQILKAADWIIKGTTDQTPEGIRGSYTFYSHVGNALSLWRSTTAPDFWKNWRATHPYVAPVVKEKDETEAEEKSAVEEAEVENKEPATEKPSDET